MLAPGIPFSRAVPAGGKAERVWRGARGFPQTEQRLQRWPGPSAALQGREPSWHRWHQGPLAPGDTGLGPTDAVASPDNTIGSVAFNRQGQASSGHHGPLGWPRPRGSRVARLQPSLPPPRAPCSLRRAQRRAQTRGRSRTVARDQGRMDPAGVSRPRPGPRVAGGCGRAAPHGRLQVSQAQVHRSASSWGRGLVFRGLLSGEVLEGSGYCVPATWSRNMRCL